MSRIDHLFADLRATGRTALMPFITGGYPSLDVTRRVLPALEKAGALIVEIGFPFSDPIADGPVIAASMHEALLSGVTPAALFDVVKSVRPALSIGLVAMVSASIIFRMGERAFIKRAAASGFDGLIIPDADTVDGRGGPAASLAEAATRAGLSCSFLIAPTSTERRIAEIVSLCSGFVYVLARTGLTGEQREAPEVAERIGLIRRHSTLPIAVGFGISTAAHVAEVTRHADAAIVGSALVRRMGEAKDPVAAASGFVRELARGLSLRAAVS